MRASRHAPALALALLAAGCSSVPSDPESVDPDSRRRAAEDLAGAGDAESVAQLRRLLADTHTACPSHPMVRGAAARSLGLTGRADVAPDLIALLEKDPSSQVRLDAATALGDLGVPAALPPLQAALARAAEPPEVRRAAARALGRIGDRAALPALARALNDPDRTVKLCAHDALVAITGNDKGLDPAAWK